MTPSLDALRAAFAACGSLHDAILLGLRTSPSWEVVDVVIQDEFTHDVIFMARPDGPALVLDCTWLGAVQAVSVWDHRPTSDELLDTRVAAGWAPTPTSTVDGDVVMGYACKLTR